MVPYSRIPGILMGASVVFTFPFIFQLVVLVQSVMGTTISLLAFLFFLLAIAFNFPIQIKWAKLGGLVQPMSHEQAFNEIRAFYN